MKLKSERLRIKSRRRDGPTGPSMPQPAIQWVHIQDGNPVPKTGEWLIIGPEEKAEMVVALRLFYGYIPEQDRASFRSQLLRTLGA